MKVPFRFGLLKKNCIDKVWMVHSKIYYRTFKFSYIYWRCAILVGRLFSEFVSINLVGILAEEYVVCQNPKIIMRNFVFNSEINYTSILEKAKWNLNFSNHQHNYLLKASIKRYASWPVGSKEIFKIFLELIFIIVSRKENWVLRWKWRV